MEEVRKVFIASKVTEIVVDRIIKKLEQGTIPWVKTWKGTSDFPVNYVTRRRYFGVNLLLLDWGGEYLTYGQIRKLGGRLKEGAKPIPVVFWKVEENSTEEKEDEEIPPEILENFEDVTPKKKRTVRYLLRYYLVYDVNQTEGIIQERPKEVASDPKYQLCEDIKNSFSKVCPIVECNCDVPRYIASVSRLDGEVYYEKILVPRHDKHISTDLYYKTLFHEIIHATGQVNRLARHFPRKRKEKDEEELRRKVNEELIAEIGSEILCSICGIDSTKTIQDTASYISSWLKVIKEDKKMVVIASSKATEAVMYVLKNLVTCFPGKYPQIESAVGELGNR